MSNKIVIAIMILLSLGIFAWLADYGWKNRYGSPETYDIVKPAELSVSHRTNDMAMEEADVFAPVWQTLPSLEVTLLPQITEKPWPEGITPNVLVQAFHNGKDIYFKLTWEDDLANTATEVDTFVDACAIAVPLDAESPIRSIMMGFTSPVNIWQWQANKDVQFWTGEAVISEEIAVDFRYPFEEQEILSEITPELQSAVTDMLAARAGSLTRKDEQNVQGRGFWRDGKWSVVFKRSLATDNPEQDSQFSGPKHTVSFAVWDGDQGDRGSRKSISDWVKLKIESATQEKPAVKQTSNNIQRPAVHSASLIGSLGSFLLANTANASAQSKSVEPAKEPRVINITAKRFEYTPNRISIKKGELVTFRLESLDVTHGLYIDGYGVKLKARPGLIGKATFQADKSGRFTFRCSETCGEFHPYMVGFLSVTPNDRFNYFIWGIGAAFAIILILVFRKGHRQSGVETDV